MATRDCDARQVQSAELTFDEMVADHDLRVLAFTKYGRDAVKDFGLSPDAWCQMAIQLAYYRYIVAALALALAVGGGRD